MTTTVIVKAHVADIKEVTVSVLDNGNPVEVRTLQDGETAELVVYDQREIRVCEVMKA